jgi:serine/threonine-protein phosphatase 2B catalytic subunit
MQDTSTYDASPELLAAKFRQQERMDLGEAIGLIEAAREVLTKEPNVLRLRAPFVVVGDIHGQFFDLLNLFKVGGTPGPQTSYLFLGDYVDRGSFSCEVMLLLLALKVTFPERCDVCILYINYLSF